jgi:hypothetical protein
MSLFGVLISGRPLLTTSQIISPTQLAYQIPTSPSFSHIVVFLLPGASLPENTAAAVYAQLPGSEAFTLLGAIGNAKPSAIFRVNGGRGGGNGSVDDGMSMGMGMEMQDQGTNGQGPSLALGISLEPIEQVQTALAQKKAQDSSTATNTATSTSGSGGGEMVLSGPNAAAAQKLLAQRIIKNCYDFLTSWGSGDTVPLKAFQAWWTKFEGKMERDPGFLERGDGG